MTATLWQEFSFSVLLSAPGTTDTPFLSYEPTLSRVRIDQSVAATAPSLPAGATRIVERSTDQIHWTTVRGGTEAPVASDALLLDDFEFDANAQDTYRIRVLVDGDLFWTFRDQITVALDPCTPWLKSIAFPFLNQPIDGATADPITRPSKSGVFPIVGRSRSVAVTDVRGGKEYALTIKTISKADRTSIEALFAPGDVVFLQVPVDYPLPGGYYSVGDVVEDPRGGLPRDRRWWTLPLVEVAPPGPDFVGATITWRGLANRFATWDDLMLVCATWRAVLDLIGVPGDVVVP